MLNCQISVDHVITSVENPSAGTTQSVLGYCRSLANVGAEVRLHALDSIPSEFAKGVKCCSYKRSKFPFKHLGRSPRLYASLKERANFTDVIHNHNIWQMPNIYAGWAALRGRCKFVTSIHGCFTGFSMSRSAWKKRIIWEIGQKRVLEAVDLFHATAESEIEDIRKMGYGQPIAYIPIGVEIPKFIPKKIKTQRTLLYLSRIHPEKRLDLLLKAWKDIENVHQEWDLKIYGPLIGEYPQSMIQLAKDMNLKRVFFMGEILGDKRWQVYRDADMFILPTRTENFGMVVAEALACQTPAITTKGAPWSQLIDHRCGWWVEESIAGIKSAIEEGMRMPVEQLKEMGMRGREWMENDYSWSHIGEELLATYIWLCGKSNVCPKCVYK